MTADSPTARLTSLPTLFMLTLGLGATVPFAAAQAQVDPAIHSRVMATRHAANQPASRVDDALLLAKEHFAELDQLIPPADSSAAPTDYAAEAERISPLLRADADGRLRVYVHVRDMNVVGALVDAGMTVDQANEEMRMVDGWIPADRLEAVAAVAGVVRIRPVVAPLVRRGRFTSAGVELLGAGALQALGIDGTGIRVGVISDGVAGLAESQASGDLPAVVHVGSARVDGDAAAGFGDEPGAEGTAMLEIIHDLAPGA
ncbi:MAG TPA: hypothetical protein P5572_11105, partial [Phycisphaerae bacterium]|nr:hypothetical protein [Phycisphaerae bacterium]